MYFKFSLTSGTTFNFICSIFARYLLFRPVNGGYLKFRNKKGIKK